MGTAMIGTAHTRFATSWALSRRVGSTMARLRGIHGGASGLSHGLLSGS
jgi:hypothetical protein